MKKILKSLELDSLDIPLCLCIVAIIVVALANGTQNLTAYIGPIVSLMSVLIALRALVETRRNRIADRMLRRPFMVIENDGIQFDNPEKWKFRLSFKYKNTGTDPAEDFSNFVVLLDENAEIVDRGNGNNSVNPLASGGSQMYTGQPIDLSGNPYGTYFVLFGLKYTDTFLKTKFVQAFMYKWVRAGDSLTFNPCNEAERTLVQKKWQEFN